MKNPVTAALIICLIVCVSCTQYTPKPRGYFRIEPDTAGYEMLVLEELPYTFNASRLSTIELPPEENKDDHWVNIAYPSLGAKIYCSYLPVTRFTLQRAGAESRELVARQVKDLRLVREKVFDNPEKQVYGSLFILGGESPSPIQFMLTDSSSRFFRGALYFDCKPNADSLAPVTDYLREDIIELIQSFSWKK